MKKILFCNVSMKSKIYKSVYKSDDFSVPVSDKEVLYPVSAFLEKTLTANDEVKVILLVKQDEFENYKKNVSDCINELSGVADKLGAKIDFKTIYTEFNEEQLTHAQLLLDIVEEFEKNAHIVSDITFGPKDLPVVLFTALNFAEKFFNCEIDNIVYGQASFSDGKPVNTKICDMVPLYYLNSVTNTVNCHSSEKAKEMLKTLLSI